MPSIVTTMPDPWEKSDFSLADLAPKFQADVTLGDDSSRATLYYGVSPTDVKRSVRRPFSGVSVKPNTVAYASVVAGAGHTVNVFNDMGNSGATTSTPQLSRMEDANLPRSRVWTDFMLQSVSESRAEKFQILETFGAPILYVFGERPRILEFSAVLVNTSDFNWRAQFFENWERFFRATRLAEANSRMYISWGDILVSGYPLNAQAQESANDPTRVFVSFSFFVTSYVNIAIKNLSSINQVGFNPGVGNPYVRRLSEFLETGSFTDMSYVASDSSEVSRFLGGPNYRFAEWMDKQRAHLQSQGVAGAGLYELLFSPTTAYIRDTRTALESMLSYMRYKLNEAAYQGVEELQKSASGGRLEVSFWFGFVAHLYRVTFINAATALGLRTKIPTNRWLNVIDEVATLGSPYAVSTYLGYSVDALAGGALYDSTTDRFSAVGNTFTASRGITPANDPYSRVSSRQLATQQAETSAAAE